MQNKNDINILDSDLSLYMGYMTRAKNKKYYDNRNMFIEVIGGVSLFLIAYAFIFLVSFL